jgi:predicted alpha/beta-fold hydrolase
MTSTGGHVGFVAPTIAPARFWAAERAMAFANGILGQRADENRTIRRATG